MVRSLRRPRTGAVRADDPEALVERATLSFAFLTAALQTSASDPSFLASPAFRRRAFSSSLPSDVASHGMQECSMSTKLYVGNLPYETTESDLQALFEASG